MAQSGDVCGVFWLDHDVYHKHYGEWGARIAIDANVEVVWCVCQCIDELVTKPDGATAIHVSPFGIVWAYD